VINRSIYGYIETLYVKADKPEITLKFKDKIIKKQSLNLNFYYYAEELGFLTWCEMPSAYNFCDGEVATITNVRQW